MKKLKIFLCLISISITSMSQVDVHVHAEKNNHDNFIKYLLRTKETIKTSYVFSSSYRADTRNFRKNTGLSFKEYIRNENNYIASLQKVYPHKVVGFCSVPWGYKKAAKEIKRCAEMGLQGLKVYPHRFISKKQGHFNRTVSNFAYDVEELNFLNILLRAAAENNLIFGIHSSEIGSTELSAFLYGTDFRHLPNLEVIFLHGFSSQGIEALETFRAHLAWDPNSKIYLEFSTLELLEGTLLYNMWADLLKYIPNKNILFGSDTATYYEPDNTQEKAIELYKNLFKDNAKEILKNNLIKHKEKTI